MTVATLSTLSDEAQDISFPLRESMLQRRFVGRMITAEKSPQESSGNFRGARKSSFDDIAKGFAQPVQRCLTRHVARESRAAAANHLLALFVQAEGDQCDIGPLRGDGAHVVQIDSVGHVDQDQIGAMGGERTSHPIEIVDDCQYGNVPLSLETRRESVAKEPHGSQNDDVHGEPPLWPRPAVLAGRL